jgi:hypothetical protein
VRQLERRAGRDWRRRVAVPLERGRRVGRLQRERDALPRDVDADHVLPARPCEAVDALPVAGMEVEPPARAIGRQRRRRLRDERLAPPESAAADQETARRLRAGLRRLGEDRRERGGIDLEHGGPSKTRCDIALVRSDLTGGSGNPNALSS